MGGEGPGSCTAVLQALDAAVALFFVCPLVVAYWRGCWQLMDQLLFPENLPVSAYSSIFIGIVPHLVFCVFQKSLEKLAGDNVPSAVYLVASRLYTVLFSITCVSHWRGVWLLWDLYTGISWQSGLLSFGLGFSLLIIANSVRNILAPPFVSNADERKGYFTIPTLFNPQVQTRNTTVWLWLTDCTFTVVVVDSLVVFVWRGGWVIVDSFLYPSKPHLSAIGSTIIGASISVIAFMTRPLLNSTLKSLRHLWLKISVELCFYALCFAATVNAWRGVWKSLDQFFLPNDRLMSNLISAVVGQTLLLLFWCSNSNLVRGAMPDKYYDEKQPSGEDLWPTTRGGPESSTNNSRTRKCNGGLVTQKSGQDFNGDGTREAVAYNNDTLDVTDEITNAPPAVQIKDIQPVQNKTSSPVQIEGTPPVHNNEIPPVQNEGTPSVHNNEIPPVQINAIPPGQIKDTPPVHNKDPREVLSLESIPPRETPSE
ncbi:Protein fuseless [Trinorchestia longiramus]|nr:Protein fuseless [Trinorchestia longiramus]